MDDLFCNVKVRCIVVRRAGAVQRKGEVGICYLDLPEEERGHDEGLAKGVRRLLAGLCRDAMEIQYNAWAGSSPSLRGWNDLISSQRRASRPCIGEVPVSILCPQQIVIDVVC